MRKLVLLVVLGLVVAGCSAGPSTSADETTTTEQAASATSADPRGPAAPDFELTLSDGSAFRLRDEEKPVYIVFWAEW